MPGAHTPTVPCRRRSRDSLRGLLVTGTDTGVGKTVLAAALVAVLRRSGERVAAYKPVVTGIDEPVAPGWPADHELLAAAAETSPDRVTSRRYGPPVSPHLAAELAHEPLDIDDLVDGARRAAAGADSIVVEGVGGLLVPLTPSASVRDLAVALGLPLLVAARPGLGTINHTLLTLEAARSAGLEVRAVVLTPWPESPSVMEESNRATIAERGGVEVACLPRAGDGTPGQLARIAARLPVRRWLGP